MHPLKNKVVLITGAASGIGEHLARRFAACGAYVVLADLNEERAQEVAKDLQNAGYLAQSYKMDVTSERDVEHVYENIAKKHRRLDVAICNAGIQHIAPVHELDYKEWKKVVNVHLDGAFLLTKGALKLMYPKKQGSIIYIGSVHSKEASLLKGPYVAAKHGIVGLCKVVAKEAGLSNIKANVICPGFVKTPLVEKQIPEQAKTLGISEEKVIKDVMLKETVDGAFTTLDDVANVALFLAGFETLALTGQSVIVSHGWCME
jgi:3-hydroxybutyrate dehydrogenase